MYDDKSLLTPVRGGISCNFCHQVRTCGFEIFFPRSLITFTCRILYVVVESEGNSLRRYVIHENNFRNTKLKIPE